MPARQLLGERERHRLDLLDAQPDGAGVLLWQVERLEDAVAEGGSSPLRYKKAPAAPTAVETAATPVGGLQDGNLRRYAFTVSNTGQGVDYHPCRLPDDGRGGPNGGASNWTSGFLPSQHQGVELRSGKTPVRDLFPAIEQPKGSDAAARVFLQQLNARHADRSGAGAMLSARMRSYELAAHMQLSVPEVSDINGEPKHIRNMYGLGEGHTVDAGQRCLLARRLLERGVRFVQIYSGGPIGGSPRASWDAHENVKDNHSTEAGRIDKPIAGLLRDLKQRGMLDDTLVLFTTEFGRTPFAQSGSDKVGPGRDHNKYGFSCWLAGGGVKAGFSFGQTDEIGWKTVENPVHWHDFHATVLHLMGVDHKKLTFYHNGIERRLTNVHGQVANGIFA